MQHEHGNRLNVTTSTANKLTNQQITWSGACELVQAANWSCRSASLSTSPLRLRNVSHSPQFMTPWHPLFKLQRLPITPFACPPPPAATASELPPVDSAPAPTQHPPVGCEGGVINTHSRYIYYIYVLIPEGVMKSDPRRQTRIRLMSCLTEILCLWFVLEPNYRLHHDTKIQFSFL